MNSDPNAETCPGHLHLLSPLSARPAVPIEVWVFGKKLLVFKTRNVHSEQVLGCVPGAVHCARVVVPGHRSRPCSLVCRTLLKLLLHCADLCASCTGPEPSFPTHIALSRVNWCFKDYSYLSLLFHALLLVSPLPPIHTYAPAFKSFLSLLANFWHLALPFHLIMSFSQAPPLWFVGPSFEPGPVTTGLQLPAW